MKKKTLKKVKSLSEDLKYLRHKELVEDLAAVMFADKMPTNTAAMILAIIITLAEDIEALERRDNVTYH